MSQTSFHQLPGPPSMQLDTVRARQKVFSSTTTGSASTTPSPAQSTVQSRLSSEISTSISDPEDYVDNPALQSMTSARVKSKVARQGSQSSDPGNRRASGRMRKPTAKAQALSVERTSPSQILDTIVIGGSPPEHSPSPAEDQPITPSPVKFNHNVLSTEIEIQETPANLLNGSTTPSKAAADGAQDPHFATPDTPLDSPSVRHSRRERKPTAKALDVSPVVQKRPAPEQQDGPPRKSARISYSATNVPSKLRYSVSSESAETEIPESSHVVDSLTEKTSKVIVLGVPRLSELFKANVPKPSPNSKAASTPKRRGRPPKHSKTSHAKPKQSSKPTAQPVKELPCLLSCLSESTRLLAMAEIAFMMPDSDDDDDEDAVPGSAQDWRTYAAQMCRCNSLTHTNTSRTNSIELQRALEPNTVSKAAQFAPIELSPTPHSEILTTPVNTLLNVKEAERVKELFTNVAGNTIFLTDPSPPPPPTNGRPPRRVRRTTLPNKPRPERPALHGDLMTFSPPPGASSVPPKRTYEDRLRADNLAMSEIRKRAGSKGIGWTFNMSFEDIQALLMDAEAPEDDSGRSKRAKTMGSGFGMLRPFRG